MHELKLGLIEIQLPEKYIKENFDVSSEGTSTCTVIVNVCTRIMINIMHGSIPAVTIPPPGNTPGICIFCKNVVNSPPPGL
jgi:hypothetical protein